MMTEREIEQEQERMEIERRHAWASRQMERLIILTLALLAIVMVVMIVASLIFGLLKG